MNAVPLVARLLLVVTMVGCAREEPPPGTSPDQQPPVVRRLVPRYGESVAGFRGSATLRFNEPISNPRNLVRQVVASPAGDYDVRPSRAGIDIRPEDGWREGVVYYLQIPAGVSDLLRNRTTEPVEWLFRVGGPVPATEVRGRLVDRVTGRGLRAGTLVFLSSDSIRYTAVSDTGGLYRLPGLPAATYTVSGFVDQDRDFVYDAEFESGGTTTLELADAARLTGIDVVMLPADSTPPVVAAARALDATRVEVTFDDPLDDADTTGVRITLRGPEGAQVPPIDAWAFGSLGLAEPEEEAPAEIGQEPAEGEEPAEEEDPAEVEPPAAVTPSLEPAPTRVTVRFVSALPAGAYEVDVAGISNLRGLIGGGTAEFEVGEQPVLEPEPAGEDDDEGETAGVDEP